MFIPLRNELVSLTRKHPLLFFPLMRLNKWVYGYGGTPLITKETELVIEGFFRCGNSFAIWAFLKSQPRAVTLANYTHAAATIIQASRWGVPALVLIREPVQTILSLALKHPHLSIKQGLKDYIRFYTTILPYQESYVLATFQEVTTDFGEVIKRVNDRFATNFVLFKHTPENVQKVFEHIKQIDQKVEQGNAIKFSIPSAEKEKAKAVLKKELDSEELKPLIAQAEAIYQEFVKRLRSREAS